LAGAAANGLAAGTQRTGSPPRRRTGTAPPPRAQRGRRHGRWRTAAAARAISAPTPAAALSSTIVVPPTWIWSPALILHLFTRAPFTIVPGLVAQIDERDVLGLRDLDHGVHARGELVVDAQMALRILADLDDVLRDVSRDELSASPW
jgi:hypothetical protein